jgi:hypothetical protein
MQRRNFITGAAIALLVLTSIVSLWFAPSAPVSAAPMAVITPVTTSGSGGLNEKVTFFNGNVTADTRVCFDLSNFNKIDLQWNIDQTIVNTTTIKLQWSNEPNASAGASTADYVDTATIASANAADATGGNEYLVSGQHNCVFVDETNTNPLRLGIWGVAKP